MCQYANGAKRQYLVTRHFYLDYFATLAMMRLKCFVIARIYPKQSREK
jgi:hypothetical protein